MLFLEGEKYACGLCFGLWQTTYGKPLVASQLDQPHRTFLFAKTQVGQTTFCGGIDANHRSNKKEIRAKSIHL